MKQSYTVTIYKFDKRTKSGDRQTDQFELNCPISESESKTLINEMHRYLYPVDKFKIIIQPTYVERTSRMTGEKILEHFNTPFSCSVASESYWQN